MSSESETERVLLARLASARRGLFYSRCLILVGVGIQSGLLIYLMVFK
jgi:hypothetical protein